MIPIKETFPDEQMFRVQLSDFTPWYADFANYLATGLMPPNLSSQQRKKFLHDMKSYFWDEPYLFKQGADQMIRRCVPDYEVEDILFHCHHLLLVDILVDNAQLQRYCNLVSFGLLYLRMLMPMLSDVIVVKGLEIYQEGMRCL